MALSDDVELIETRRKLTHLESRYAQLVADSAEDPEIREITLESLLKFINQFRQEIAQYVALHPEKSRLITPLTPAPPTQNPAA